MSKTAVSPETFLTEVARESWELFKADALLMVLSSLLVGVCGGLSLGILLGPLTVGFIRIIRQRRRGEPATFGDVFYFDHFVGSLLALVLVSLAIMLGLMLLVVPGLIVAIFCVFTFHEIAYQQCTAIEAIKASVALARDNFIHVLGLVIVLSLFNGIAGALVLASLVTAPLSMIATVVAYELLTGVRALPARGSSPADTAAG